MVVRRARRSEVEAGKPSPIKGPLAARLRDRAIKDHGSERVSSFEVFSQGIKGLPLTGNLALQHMLGVDILPVGRAISVVGDWGTTKSSLSWAIAKSFLKAGGMVLFVNTEMKVNPDQIAAIVGEPELLENIIMDKAYTLDEVISHIQYYTTQYLEMVPNKDVPFCIILDSLNAITSEESKKKQSEDESNAYAGARNAAAFQEFLKVFCPNYLDPNPILFLVVNHQKTKIQQGPVRPGMPPQKHEPGGVHKDFMYTYKIELAKAGAEKTGAKSPLIRLKLGKSSFGKTHKHGIMIPYRSFWDDKEQEHIYYDWNSALSELLTSKNILVEARNKALHLTRNGNKFSSTTLGLKDVTATEMGAAIHANPDVCEKLKKLLWIRTKSKIGEVSADLNQPLVVEGSFDPTAIVECDEEEEVEVDEDGNEIEGAEDSDEA